ncbi:MAG: prepilin-type N-terminal cleavage/methylation domain-containing protein [Thermoanaerobaculia bacterium]
MTQPVCSRKRHEAGYSLAEILVVVAIIGVMSLVAVPSFINMYQSSRLKSGLRQFTSDLRGARQTAVTEYRWVKVDFETGTSPSRYWIRKSSDLGLTWDEPPIEKEIIEPITIDSTTFTDGADDGAYPEIIFRNNGTIANIPAGEASRNVVIETPAPIAKPVVTITINPTGKIAAE